MRQLRESAAAWRGFGADGPTGYAQVCEQILWISRRSQTAANDFHRAVMRTDGNPMLQAVRASRARLWLAKVMLARSFPPEADGTFAQRCRHGHSLHAVFMISF